MNSIFTIAIAVCLASVAYGQINININWNNEQSFGQNFEQLGNIFSNWQQVFNFWQSQFANFYGGAGNLIGGNTSRSAQIMAFQAREELSKALSQLVQAALNMVSSLFSSSNLAQTLLTILNKPLFQAIGTVVEQIIQNFIQHH